jgi:uncharacterized membrane protein YfcA
MSKVAAKVMESITWIDQIVFPVFILWFVGIILVLFRKDLEILWKVSFLFLFVVYLILFGKEWSLALDRLESNPGWEIRNYIYGMGKAIFYFLFILWPITMIRLYYTGSKELAKHTASLLVTITIIYWMLFWLYFHFMYEVDEFFSGRFQEWFIR